MKRILFLFLCVALFSGCKSQKNELDRAMSLRQRLLDANGCSFRVQIFADYEDSIYSFIMDCTADEYGNVSFSVVEPESIEGICGSVSSEGGMLTFDEELLAFPLLADGQITPVSAPWVMLKSLRGGYIQGAGASETGIQICLEDSYQEDPLTVEIYTDQKDFPISAEILWRGKRILSMQIAGFCLL